MFLHDFQPIGGREQSEMPSAVLFVVSSGILTHFLGACLYVTSFRAIIIMIVISILLTLAAFQAHMVFCTEWSVFSDQVINNCEVVNNFMNAVVTCIILFLQTEANPKNVKCTVSQALVNYLIRDDFSSLYTVFQQGCCDSRLLFLRTEANPKNANCTVSQALVNYLIRDDFSSPYTIFQQGCCDSRLIFAD